MTREELASLEARMVKDGWRLDERRLVYSRGDDDVSLELERLVSRRHGGLPTNRRRKRERCKARRRVRLEIAKVERSLRARSGTVDAVRSREIVRAAFDRIEARARECSA